MGDAQRDRTSNIIHAKGVRVAPSSSAPQARVAHGAYYLTGFADAFEFVTQIAEVVGVTRSSSTSSITGRKYAN
jgi:hypothetical protein